MSTRTRIAAHALLVLALFVAAANADARGGRRGGGSRAGSSAAKPHADSEGGGGSSSNLNLTLRSGSGSGSDTSSAQEPGGYGATTSRPAPTRPVLPQRAADKPYTPEEVARHEAAMAAYEKDQAEHANQAKLAAAKMEAQRAADEKAAAEKAARKAAEESAIDARAAAALAEKKRAEAAIAADVDRVLQRAKADHPVLATPEGEPVLRMILERQQALVARGMYPGIAMVEAVADHTSRLAPRDRVQATQAVAPVSNAPSRAFGGCYWKTPSVWACN